MQRPGPGNETVMPSKNADPDLVTAPQAPSGPQLSPQRPAKRGPNPFVVAGAAFAAGSVLAKLIDWRGHAHPRR